MASLKRDPCGICCVLITYAAIVYADYVVVRHVVLPTLSDTLWGVVNVVLFNSLLFLVISAHLRAVLSDPGTVPLPDTTLDFSDLHSPSGGPSIAQRMSKESGWTVCMKCETYRPPRAHHCRVCRRCVRRMDHHCPWINNCVGETNQKFFIQFLFYVGVVSLYAIGLVVVSFIIDPTTTSNSANRHVRIVHSIVLVVESLLFGLFVFAISCDQLQAILGDETGVEQAGKQGMHRSNLSRRALLAEVFGRGPVLCWLNPFQPWRPVRDEFGDNDYLV